MQLETTRRNYVEEWRGLEKSQASMAEQKDTLYREWAGSVKARIKALKNPETGRPMSVSAFQQLLDGYSTKSPILLNALRCVSRSVPLLTAATRLLGELEQDARYTPEVSE